MMHASLGLGQGRHGEELHYIRPDAVMRSSILTAIPGYQPVSNAHGVAERFTRPSQGPLMGVLGAIPLLSRLKLRIQSAFARRRAEKFVRAANASGMGLGDAPISRTQVPYWAAYALPSTSGPGQYGVGPSAENMRKVGLEITSGLPPGTTMPGVAESEYAASFRVAPNYSARPSQLIGMVGSYAPPYVANAAQAAAMARFRGVRTWWYG